MAHGLEVTPKALRLHIGIMGRTNVGKSSFLNMIAGQDVAITSDQQGTTTDVVEKTMELLPFGPVVILDTAGIDDTSILSEQRKEKTEKAVARMGVVVLVTEAGVWGDYEEAVLARAKEGKKPLLVVINKTDIARPSEEFLSLLELKKILYVQGSATSEAGRGLFIEKFKNELREVLPGNFSTTPPLIGDLCPAGSLAVFVVPIDLGAPKGRLIAPQVQSIRDILDNDASVLVTKDREYADTLKRLSAAPDLVVCDSQVVTRTVADTPPDVKLTTFSILFARLKGDLAVQTRGAAIIEKLKDGDKVLIAEGCSHHPIEDDIGRVKIPRWLRQYTGCQLEIDHAAGHDFPPNLEEYKLVIHCGGCVMTREEMMSRLDATKKKSVPMTNYGIAISVLQGVLKRALSPFPEALAAYEDELKA